MLLGWLMVALAAVLAVVWSIYVERRKKWIARLPPGTMYRPVTGVSFIAFLGVLGLWTFGMQRLGNDARWPYLAVVVIAVVLAVQRRRRRRQADR